MPKNYEKNKTRVTKPRATIAAIAATALLLAGCSGNGKKEVATRSSSVPTTVAPVPSTTETMPYDSFTYENNPQRVARIETAVQNLGLIVLNEASKSRSNWGPFDAYCSDTQEGGSNQGGWVSQGYKPAAGEDCEVQHNPQYGEKNVQVSTDVLVGDNGVYTNNIEGAFINNPYCSVSVSYSNINKVPIVTIGTAKDLQTVGSAQSLAQAESIDNQAISCLDNTRPS